MPQSQKNSQILAVIVAVTVIAIIAYFYITRKKIYPNLQITVKDTDGYAIANALVTIEDVNVWTNISGTAIISEISNGEWDVTVTHPVTGDMQTQSVLVDGLTKLDFLFPPPPLSTPPPGGTTPPPSAKIRIAVIKSGGLPVGSGEMWVRYYTPDMSLVYEWFLSWNTQAFMWVWLSPWVMDQVGIVTVGHTDPMDNIAVLDFDPIIGINYTVVISSATFPPQPPDTTPPGNGTPTPPPIDAPPDPGPPGPPSGVIGI